MPGRLLAGPGIYPAGSPGPGRLAGRPAYDNAPVSPGAPPAAEMPWKEIYADARLQRVIEAALANNRDLRIAALNAERARAMYGVQRAALYPTVDAQARGAKQRVPADLSRSGSVSRPEEYNVNLGIASWEIDFFGRIRSLKDAALEEYLATEQARRSAQILLVSGVANAWLSLAADRENLRLAQSTIETQQGAYDLIRKRYDVGLSPELDLRQAQTRVDTARVDAALYARQVAQDENALDLLVGSKVPAELLPADLSTVIPPKEIAAGLPSDVLLRRPDILQSESRLKAVNANIGAARAALFPRISLTASFGTTSTELDRLFSNGQGSWNFASGIVLPIFDARAWSALDVVKIGTGARPGPVREGHPVGLPGSGRRPRGERHDRGAAGGAAVADRGRGGDVPPLQPAVREGDRQLPGRPRRAPLPVCGAAGADLHPPGPACRPGEPLRRAGRGYRLKRCSAAKAYGGGQWINDPRIRSR